MNLKQVFLGTALLTGAALPASALELSFGATIASDYIARGVTQTANGAAFQPWVEAESNGWYAGLWASNVSLAPDTAELDIYGGYRWGSDSTSFDVGYVRYLYDNTGDAGGELYALVEHTLANQVALSGGLYLGHAGGLTLNDIHIGVSAPISDGFSASLRIGRTPGSFYYGDIGIGWDVSETFSLEARYHQASGINGRVVLSAGLSF